MKERLAKVRGATRWTHLLAFLTLLVGVAWAVGAYAQFTSSSSYKAPIFKPKIEAVITGEVECECENGNGDCELTAEIQGTAAIIADDIEAEGPDDDEEGCQYWLGQARKLLGDKFYKFCRITERENDVMTSTNGEDEFSYVCAAPVRDLLDIIHQLLKIVVQDED